MSDYIGTCPYCKGTTYADSVDVGVGYVQCGPYHCENCGASEIGPELDDWCYKDREGKTIYTTGKRRYWSWLRKGKGGKSRSREDYSKKRITLRCSIHQRRIRKWFLPRANLCCTTSFIVKVSSLRIFATNAAVFCTVLT